MSELIFHQKQRVGEWVANKIGMKNMPSAFYAMGIERNGEIVAGFLFESFNGSNANAHVAIEKPTKAIYTLLHHAAHYAFNVCKLNRLTGLVTASNEKAYKLDLHLGWEHEFTMKKAGKDGEDMHVLVMWPEKCKWLAKGDSDEQKG